MPFGTTSSQKRHQRCWFLQPAQMSTAYQTRPGSVRLEASTSLHFRYLQLFAHMSVCFLGMLGAEFVSWPKHRYEQYPSKAWFSSHILSFPFPARKYRRAMLDKAKWWQGIGGKLMAFASRRCVPGVTGRTNR